MGRLKIGLTCSVEHAAWNAWRADVILLTLNYVRAVWEAGGYPIVLPPVKCDHQDVLTVVNGVDGVVFTGGCDIDPRLFGATRHSESGPIQPERDEFEIMLLDALLERDIPCLGICRGMQLFNVALGGSLLQHLPEQVGHSEHCPQPGSFSEHRISIDEQSKLGTALGASAVVKSHHHQAPEKIGRGINVTARSSDGTIEAIEVAGFRYFVGVLWHPEEGASRRLFESFIRACREAKMTPHEITRTCP